MRGKRAKNPTWSCCNCGKSIKYGEKYVWWWMPNLVRCGVCVSEMDDINCYGDRYERGVREKAKKTGIVSKRLIKGQMSLLDKS